jgi:WS/DGAT/MGAT family acyltransferase
MLRAEDAGWRQAIGLIAIIEGQGLLEPDGSIRIDRLREHIGGRLNRLPRFRQVLRRPGLGLGAPVWVDVATVDLEHHIRVEPLTGSGDEEDLLHACETLRRLELDPLRPLWQMWFLTGLNGGRIGLFVKLHHSAADGMAGIGALAALVDTEPTGSSHSPPDWTPARSPTDLDLLRDNWAGKASRLLALVRSLARPRRLLARFGEQVRVMWQLLAEGPAPQTSINRVVGPRRRLTVIGGELDWYRAVARSTGTKVNDVLLAVVGEGLRELLLARGETIDHLVLRVMVPLSLHDRATTQGNLGAGMLVPVPIDTTPAHRLQLVAAETSARKSRVNPSMGTGLLRSAPIQMLVFRLMGRQRLSNSYLSNIPGPPVPVFLAGARILEMFPVVPIIGNITIGVGALSYAGRLDLTVVADFDACPDLDPFRRGVERALSDLPSHTTLARVSSQWRRPTTQATSSQEPTTQPIRTM